MKFDQLSVKTIMFTTFRSIIALLKLRKFINITYKYEDPRTIRDITRLMDIQLRNQPIKCEQTFLPSATPAVQNELCTALINILWNDGSFSHHIIEHFTLLLFVDWVKLIPLA